MRVLVSNDDGVDAAGIRVLAQTLREAGHEVLVVAPDRDRSGASNSLTLDAPVRVHQLDASTWRVHGTAAARPARRWTSASYWLQSSAGSRSPNLA